MSLYSDISINSATFMIERMARNFLKARDAVIKNKHPQLIEEKKAEARAAKNALQFTIKTTGVDIDAAKVVADYCGYGREWKANQAAVEAAALEHQISNEQARDMLAATMANAQLYSQSTRGNLAGIYEGWLADINPDDGIMCDVSDKAISEMFQQSYKKAGEWMRRDEGVLIEAEAAEYGVILPKWADVLPKVTEQTELIKQRIQRNLEAKQEAASAAYIDAMREIDPTDW